MNYLLHTDVLEAAADRRLTPALRGLLDRTPPTHLHLSALALAEVLKAVELRQPPAPELAAWLRRIPAEYGDRLLPADAETALAYASLAVQLRQNGQTLDLVDGLAAATALRHDLTLVTERAGALARCGVRIWNPAP